MVNRTSETGGQDLSGPSVAVDTLEIGWRPSCSEDTHRLLEMQSLGDGLWHEVTTKVVRVNWDRVDGD